MEISVVGKKKLVTIKFLLLVLLITKLIIKTGYNCQKLISFVIII